MNKLSMIFMSFLLLVGCVTKSDGQNLSKKQTEQLKNKVDSVFQEMIVFAEKLDFDKLSFGVDDLIHTKPDLLQTGNIILVILL